MQLTNASTTGQAIPQNIYRDVYLHTPHAGNKTMLFVVMSKCCTNHKVNLLSYLYIYIYIYVFFSFDLIFVAASTVMLHDVL